eukprot:scaffold70761_cov24-Tisochrysis_lutea.AAC.2
MLKDLQDISYLLSPQDLMAVSHVPELINSGVGCFKIEGRLKGPEYVALTTQTFEWRGEAPEGEEDVAFHRARQWRGRTLYSAGILPA